MFLKRHSISWPDMGTHFPSPCPTKMIPTKDTKLDDCNVFRYICDVFSRWLGSWRVPLFTKRADVLPQLPWSLEAVKYGIKLFSSTPQQGCQDTNSGWADRYKTGNYCGTEGAYSKSGSYPLRGLNQTVTFIMILFSNWTTTCMSTG